MMTRTKGLNLAAAALMLVLVILQFVPYWQFAKVEDATVMRTYAMAPGELSWFAPEKEADPEAPAMDREAALAEAEFTTLSIGDYVWFPADKPQKALENGLKAALDNKDFSVNDVVPLLVAVFLLAVIGTVVCSWKANAKLAALLPVACGLTGILAYAVQPAMQLGMAWGWHIVLSAVILAVGLAALLGGKRKA